MNAKDLADNALIKTAEKLKTQCMEHRATNNNESCLGCVFHDSISCVIDYPFMWDIPEKRVIVYTTSAA